MTTTHSFALRLYLSFTRGLGATLGLSCGIWLFTLPDIVHAFRTDSGWLSHLLWPFLLSGVLGLALSVSRLFWRVEYVLDAQELWVGDGRIEHTTGRSELVLRRSWWRGWHLQNGSGAHLVSVALPWSPQASLPAPLQELKGCRNRGKVAEDA